MSQCRARQPRQVDAVEQHFARCGLDQAVDASNQRALAGTRRSDHRGDAALVEGVAGVNLPMLVRVFTYRMRGMDTLIKKAVSGGCEGVLQFETVSAYAPARS